MEQTWRDRNAKQLDKQTMEAPKKREINEQMGEWGGQID